jgi:hypothetical protein
MKTERVQKALVIAANAFLYIEILVFAVMILRAY